MSPVPLYNAVNRSAPQLDSCHKPHYGLWWERFCDLYELKDGTRAEGKARSDRESSPKLNWINTLTKKPCGDAQMLERAQRRTADLCHALHGEPRTFTSDWRFATGLGIDHPVENGFAWHPTLGVPYLPGCAVKGLLHAWLTHWGDEGGRKIAPRWLGTPHEAGKFIFFDALPPEPVRLTADVMTPHMGKWYSEGESIRAVSFEEREKVPADWHNPNPIPFLAVPEGARFMFAVAPRTRSNSKDEDRKEVAEVLEQIEQALKWIGAGAKTAAGYGRFTAVATAGTPAGPSSASRESPRSLETTLRLVSPAFLAGADQEDPDDCELRVPTLRGQLRWWWRTMHAGHLDYAMLHRLEGAIWGDTGAGSPVQMTLETLGDPRPQEANLKQHGPGLLVLVYGMHKPARNRQRGASRYYLEAGTEWRLNAAIRDSALRPEGDGPQEQPITAESIEAQVRAALWLLCTYGGVGAKSRNGLGSLASESLRNITSLDDCMRIAREMRRHLGIDGEAVAHTPSLDHRLGPIEVSLLCSDAWCALHRIGGVYRDFIQANVPRAQWRTGHGKHCQGKRALGLPRKIHGPLSKRRIGHQREPGHFHKPPENLEKGWPIGNRHAKPFHFHLAPNPDGEGFLFRCVAFPSRWLPGRIEPPPTEKDPDGLRVLPDDGPSRQILEQLMQHMEKNLRRIAGTHR